MGPSLCDVGGLLLRHPQTSPQAQRCWEHLKERALRWEEVWRVGCRERGQLWAVLRFYRREGGAGLKEAQRGERSQRAAVTRGPDTCKGVFPAIRTILSNVIFHHDAKSNH